MRVSESRAILPLMPRPAAWPVVDVASMGSIPRPPEVLREH